LTTDNKVKPTNNGASAPQDLKLNKNYDYTGAKRQAAYTDRLKAKGLKQVRCWIYKEDTQALKDHAEQLVLKREEAEAKKPS